MKPSVIQYALPLLNICIANEPFPGAAPACGSLGGGVTTIGGREKLRKGQSPSPPSQCWCTYQATSHLSSPLPYVAHIRLNVQPNFRDMRFWRALGENLGDFIVSVACKFAIYGQILDFLASQERLVPSIQNGVYRIVRLDFWRRNSQLTHQEVSNTDSERIVLPGYLSTFL